MQPVVLLAAVLCVHFAFRLARHRSAFRIVAGIVATATYCLLVDLVLCEIVAAVKVRLYSNQPWSWRPAPPVSRFRGRVG